MLCSFYVRYYTRIKRLIHSVFQPRKSRGLTANRFSSVTRYPHPKNAGDNWLESILFLRFLCPYAVQTTGLPLIRLHFVDPPKPLLRYPFKLYTFSSHCMFGQLFSSHIAARFSCWRISGLIPSSSTRPPPPFTGYVFMVVCRVTEIILFQATITKVTGRPLFELSPASTPPDRLSQSLFPPSPLFGSSSHILLLFAISKQAHAPLLQSTGPQPQRAHTVLSLSSTLSIAFVWMRK